MRNKFDEQLLLLNHKLTEMGALCERFIALAANAVLKGGEGAEEIIIHGREVDEMEHEIEGICLKLLLHRQPVASDLRQISAALKMITDMERIGDQCEDIAEIIPFLGTECGREPSEFKTMAEATCKMVTDSIDAFVGRDLKLAHNVAKEDDTVDDCFVKVKQKLIAMISDNTADAEYATHLLMIAKYFERIGDHAVNIAEWVEFSVTGVHKGE